MSCPTSIGIVGTVVAIVAMTLTEMITMTVIRKGSTARRRTNENGSVRTRQEFERERERERESKRQRAS